MTRYELIYTTTRWGLFVRAWEGDEASHVLVRIGDEAIHSTALRGVHVVPLEDALHGVTIVQRMPVIPRTVGMGEQAETNLRAKIGKRYDYLGIAGFPLLRDLDSPGSFWCSELAQSFVNDATGLALPGRTGRWGVRLSRIALASYLQGLQHAQHPGESLGLRP
jgi:hypothetical protein